MSQPHKKRAVRQVAVLYLGRQWAEWLPSGESVELGRAEVGGLSATDLVSAAEAACAAAGEKPGPCVVAWSEELARLGTVLLPQTGERETKQVLQRRASRFLEDGSEDVFFTATRSFASDDEKNARPWCISVLPRELAHSVHMGLRRTGFRVRGGVSLPLATINGMHAHLGGGDEAGMVISAGHANAHVALVTGDELVNRESYSGTFGEKSSLEASLVQDVRTRASYWKKKSRGEDVKWIGIVGIDPGRAELMRNSLSVALPNTRVQCFPESIEGPAAVRRSVLETALHSGPFGGDLSYKLPPRRPVFAGFLLATTALAAVPAAVVHEDLTDDLAQLQGETRQLLTHAAGLSNLEAQAERARESVEGVITRIQRHATVSTSGVPIEHLMHVITRAFLGRAQLLTLDMDQTPEGGTRLVVRGLTDPDPVHSARATRGIREALLADGAMDEVTVLPPGRIPGQGDMANDDYLTFTLEALVRGAEQ